VCSPAIAAPRGGTVGPTHGRRVGVGPSPPQKGWGYRRWGHARRALHLLTATIVREKPELCLRSDSSGFVLTAVQKVPKHINTAPIAGNTRNREFHKVRYLCVVQWAEDRKSTRLNSSHVSISYAVFCLK